METSFSHLVGPGVKKFPLGVNRWSLFFVTLPSLEEDCGVAAVSVDPGAKTMRIPARSHLESTSERGTEQAMIASRSKVISIFLSPLVRLRLLCGK